MDYNLKFNKPELDITIDREKAARAGRIGDGRLQPRSSSPSAPTDLLFHHGRHQYSVITQVNIGNRDQPLGLSAYYVRNNKGRAYTAR